MNNRQSENIDSILQNAISGSYRPEQVLFLLKPVEIEHTDPKQKEYLIQSGQKHYSQMISHEKAPSEQHLALYRQALTQERMRYAEDVQKLANALISHYQNAPELVLVSLVRAGVPLGVLLKDALTDLNQPCVHYGMSILRDRGIDFAALECIIAKHGADHIVFVDGWTGKGAIKTELKRSIGDDPRFKSAMQKYGHDDLPLVTLADLAGVAWLTASAEDWLIPSGILGATISGLISRSMCENPLTASQINAERLAEWHGCAYYQHLSEWDYSQDFVREINACRQQIQHDVGQAVWTTAQRQQQAKLSQNVIQQIASQYQVDNLNRIKPSIAEATRAILRRVPELVILREADNPNTALLRYLTTQTNTPIVINPDIAPYHAITLIQKVKK